MTHRNRLHLHLHLADLEEFNGTLLANQQELAKADEEIRSLEEAMSSIGDDAQLANVDLQNMLQKQQQTLQLLSTISRSLHQTTVAVIRKIGS